MQITNSILKRFICYSLSLVFALFVYTSVSVAQCPVIPTPAVTTTDNNSCTNPNGSISITAPLPLSNYSFSIDGGITYQAGSVFTGLTGGRYNVMARSVSSPLCVSAPVVTVVGSPAQFASTPFSISDATTIPINDIIASPLVTLPNAAFGIVFDLYLMDNAFNLKVNGVNIANDELQFYMPHPTGVKFEFTDGAPGAGSYYGGSFPLPVNDIWLMSGNATAPLFRVVISEEGVVSIFGARVSGGPLFPMRLRVGTFNIVPINKTSSNTIQLTQTTDGPTYATGTFNQVTMPPMTISAVSSTPASCAFVNAGTATVSVTGGQAPYTYLWQNGESTASTAGLAVGGNTLTVTDAYQCTYKVNVMVGLSLADSQRTTINHIICQGQNYFGYNATGIYIDTLLADNGCTNIRTINLTVKTAIAATVNETICQGQSFLGHTTAGVYIDTLATAEGCDSIQTTTLSVKPSSFITINQTICQGDIFLGYSSTGVYTDTLIATNGCDSIRTILLTVNSPSSSFITKDICSGESFLGYSVAGTYIDTLTATNGCDSIRTLVLNVFEIPRPFIGFDTTICTGNTLLLQTSKYDSYLWQDGSTDRIFTVTQPGLYEVTVTNICGTAKDNINIDMQLCDVYFPTAFAPEGSGANKQFRLLNGSIVAQLKLTVCNRLGQILFETSDITKGWNGTYKGKPQAPGTYVYYGEYSKDGIARKVQFKGTVVLVR